MITKMTKYSFILMTEEKEGFLEQLQELGVVDISRSVKPVDQDSSAMLAKASRAKKTLEFLESIDYTKDADAEAIAKTTIEIDGDPVAFVEKCQTRLAELNIELAAARKQMDARLPWGEYDKKAIDSLSDLGYKVRYYVVDKKRFDQTWAGQYPLQVIEEDGKNVHLIPGGMALHAIVVCGEEQYEHPGVIFKPVRDFAREHRFEQRGTMWGRMIFVDCSNGTRRHYFDTYMPL